MTESRKRIAIFARYGLPEQYKLAAEFQSTLERLGSVADVLHLSLRSKLPAVPVPGGVSVQELPFRVDRASPRSILLKSLLLYGLLPVVGLKLRRFRPDVVYISEALPLYAALLKLLFRLRVSTVYGDRHLHNRLGERWWSRPILRVAEWLERSEFRYLDAIFIRTAAARERLYGMGVPRSRMPIIVYDVPDFEAYHPRDMTTLRMRCGFGPDDVVLNYHGVMHRGKGLDDLIRWTADLYREDPRMGIIMVGTGPELEPLRELAHSCGLGTRAVFTGWLPTLKDVGDYCCASDICVAMRRGDESNDFVLPGALVHSMACRKVVIAPRLAGMSEVIRDGENGFLFCPNDGADFKRLLRELVNRRPEWSTFAERAHQDILARHSVRVAADRYVEALLRYAGAEGPEYAASS